MSATFKNYRQQSRDVQWGKECTNNEGMTIEQINCGSFLRIADALERIAHALERTMPSVERLSNAAGALIAERNRIENSRRRTRRDYRVLSERVAELENRK